MRVRPMVLLALALTLTAACDSSGGQGVSTVPSGQRDGRAWAQCMRTNGIPVPDPDPVTGQLPGFDKGSQDPEKFRKAGQACAALEPVRPGRNNDPLTPAEMEQKREWSVCMRQNGVPVPDPDPNDPNGPRFDLLANMPPVTVIDKALEVCNHLLPRP